MSKQQADLSGVKIPDLTGRELKPGYGIPYEPTKHLSFQEQAVQRRESVTLEATRYDWALPTLYIVAGMVCLILALKVLRTILSAAKNPARSTLVYSLYLAIRGARKVSGASASLWAEAKAADKKIAKAEHTD